VCIYAEFTYLIFNFRLGIRQDDATLGSNGFRHDKIETLWESQGQGQMDPDTTWLRERFEQCPDMGDSAEGKAKGTDPRALTFLDDDLTS
jgi:hypothetical protein